MSKIIKRNIIAWAFFFSFIVFGLYFEMIGVNWILFIASAFLFVWAND